MEIKGKVLTLFPVKEGVGKTSGTPWKSREFVIETQDQYPKRICLQVMNDNMDRFPRRRVWRSVSNLTFPSNQEGENR